MGSQEKAFATQIDDASLPRGLELRDSFTTYLTAPLSEHFRFCEYQWTNDFHPQEILEEKPDVLIDEIAERHLYEEFHEHVPPDILQREMAQGAEWTDTVAISNRELKGASQLGISIYRPGKETMLCDAPNSDWNTRFVIPFSNLAQKQD